MEPRTVGRLDCVSHSFAYVDYFVFLRDVWTRTHTAAIASRRATNLATHLLRIIPRSLGRVLMADPVDELDNDQLEDIPEVLDLLHAGGEVGQRSVLVRVDQHHKRVPLRQGSKNSFFAWSIIPGLCVKVRYLKYVSKVCVPGLQ